jgi:hypothetical protein
MIAVAHPRRGKPEGGGGLSRSLVMAHCSPGVPLVTWLPVAMAHLCSGSPLLVILRLDLCLVVMACLVPKDIDNTPKLL